MKMKKAIIATFVATLALTSCNGVEEQVETPAVDSVAVDSVAVDSVAVEVVDSVPATDVTL
jgi:PBP1b-binding outer membrane lipoprotein LpoB